jgi:uncharacterized membrane protein YdjX (TVP38/TMEM64 family)
MKPQKKLLLIGSFLFFIFLLVEFFGIRSDLSPKNIKDLFLTYQTWGILIFCLAFSLGNLLYIPGWIFLVGAVFALGKEWGGLVTYIGAIVSSLISFIIIQRIGGDSLRSLNGKLANKFFSKLDKHPITSILFLRMIFQTVPALNYALALARVRLHHYILGTLLGLPLPIFIYCYFFEFIFKHVLN